MSVDLSKFKGFTHTVAVALVSVAGSTAYYLTTHPDALRAVNDFLAAHRWGAVAAFILSQLLLLYHNPTNGNGATTR